MMQKKTATSYEFLEDIISYESFKENGKNKCCDRISKELNDMDFDVTVFRTYGSPIIYAEYDAKAAKNILFYMHYDVKPVGNIDAWNTNPFELSYDAEQNKFFARGAGDDKGQIYSVIMGIRKALESGEQPKYNIAVLIEGDEESSSPGLALFSKNELKNKCYNMIIVFDSHWLQDKPIVYLGCRGQLDITITYDDSLMQGNCHAGNFGGIYNGAGRYLLSTLEQFLKDAEEIVDEANTIKDGTLKNAISLTYFSTGDAHRSLIPKVATAGIDVRYISNKVLQDIEELLKNYVSRYEITYDIRQREQGFYNKADQKQVGRLTSILSDVTGQTARVLDYCGAYLPLRKMDSINGTKYVIPLAQSDEHNHAPNENISVDNVEYGIEIVSRLLLDKALGGKNYEETMDYI